MPLRITATDPRNKHILFKNRRCTLFGWTLHEENKEQLHRCSTPEMPVRYFNVQVLLNTEAEDKSYRATCSICEASNVDTEHTSEEALRCKVSDKTNPSHAFRPDNHKRKCDWACLDCESPSCTATGCNVKPDRAQTSQGWILIHVGLS